MGRDAHVLRVILGRGATRQPYWEALTDQYERVGRDPVIYQGIDPDNALTYGRLFDAKGRAYCPELPEERHARAEALNHVTSILKHNAALESQPKPSAEIRPEDCIQQISGSRKAAASLLCLITVHGTEMIDYFFRDLRQRLLIFRGIGDGLDGASILECLDERRFGGLLGSYLPRLIESLMRFEGLIVHNPNLHRMSMARFPMTPWRLEMYQDFKILSMLAVETVLSLDADLQSLHLLPSSTWSSPIPLLPLFMSLSGPQKLHTIIHTILPATLVRKLWTDKLFPIFIQSVKTIKFSFTSLRNIAHPTQSYQRRMFETHILHGGSHLPQRSLISDEQSLRGPFSSLTTFATHAYVSLRLFGPTYQLVHRGETAFQALRKRFSSDNIVQTNGLKNYIIGTSNAVPHYHWLIHCHNRHVSSLRSELLLLPINILFSRFLLYLYARDTNLASFSSKTQDLYPIMPRSIHFPTVGRISSMLARTYLYQMAISTAIFGVAHGVYILASRWRTRRQSHMLRG